MTYPPNDPNNPSGWPTNGHQGQSGSGGWEDPTTQHNPGGQQPSGGWNTPPTGGYQQPQYGSPAYGTSGYDANAYGTGGYGTSGQPPQGPKKNTGWIIGIAVGAVVVIVLAVVLGVMLTKNSKSDNKSSGTSSSATTSAQTTDTSSTPTSDTSDNSDIENVIHVYLNALVNEDWSKARSVSCSSNDEPNTMSSSAMNTSGYYVKKIVVDDISNIDVQPDRSSATADVAVTLTDDNSSSNSGSWMARMQRSGGEWKLCSIN